MTQALLDEDGWSGIVRRLPSGLDLSASAREHGAFLRARGVSSASHLLRLALIYGATALSLRGTAAWAEAAGVARLSDVALLGRLQSANGWLGAIVDALLSAAIQPTVARPAATRRVRLIDATTIAGPGGLWRVHSDYDLQRGRFIGLVLSEDRQSESLERFDCGPGDIMIADRYYAKARQLHHVAAGGGDFLVRRGITGCTVRHANGEPFDLKATLAAVGDGQTIDIPVIVPAPIDAPAEASATPLRARLIIRHMGEGAAPKARERARRKAARVGQKAMAKRLKAAEYIMLLTSLDAARFPTEQALALYRLRWQIEIAFKRLKSLIGLADLTAKEPRLVRACLYAKLIFALLGEDVIQDLLDSPPSADRYAAALGLAASTPRPPIPPARHLRTSRARRLHRSSHARLTQHRRTA